MWEGSYLSRTSESVFSWSVITEMTEGLIEHGEYKIKLGLQNAPIVAEQLALFDMGGDAPVYEAPAGAPSGILAPGAHGAAGGHRPGTLHRWKRTQQRRAHRRILYAGAVRIGKYIISASGV